jgi:hypothetical protein
MSKLLYVLPLALTLCAAPAQARKKKNETPPAKVEKKAPIAKGFFGVQREKDDVFFVIPDSLLRRPMLVTTRFISTPAGAQVYGGELAGSKMLTWERHNNQLLLRAEMFESLADSTQRIWKSVEASAENPIVAAFKIEETIADSTSKLKQYRIKVTDFLKGDNPVTSLETYRKTGFDIGGLRGDLSYIDTVKTFPINTEIQTVKTFSAKPNKIPSAAVTGLVTLRLNTSFVLLPENLMRSRTFDPRVGYFTDNFVEFDDKQQQVKRRSVVARWRLEPKEEDIEKMKRGELVEPKKPIVYYIDPATPKQWVKYLILGVEDWQKAFEQAGFKNAIIAKEWPKDRPDMSLEDARFSVIRYLASPIPNAYGPNVHDPRTGEIIESHIGWYHNVMKLVHDWYMVQAGAVDPRARKQEFDEELMGQLIRFVSSHEVGHTLGLRHNMGASAATPVEKLRDKAWVEKHGHTSSIMDYARFNYVAQPEDNISSEGIFPRINDYDKWAIQWGYSYFPNAKSEKEERKILNDLTVKTITGNRRLWFGGEGHDNDPLALTEDLSDDVMKASDYGLKNLRRVVKGLPEWIYEEGNLGDNLAEGYKAVFGQYRRYVGHVLAQIGGVHREYKSVEQSGAVFKTMTRERQQRALAWLDKNVLECPTWMISEPYISRLSAKPQELIRPLAEMAVSYLVSPNMFNNIAINATGAPTAQAYTPTAYADDLLRVLFRETTTPQRVGSWRRYVQQQAVTRLIKGWKATADGDGRPYMTSLLTRIQSRLTAAHPQDAATRAHYAELSRQIRLAMEGK